jgi:nucleoside-diphosphate-sugar epimerase
MSRVVVTNGLGYLGFELCLAILEEGLEVMAVDSEEKAGERWLEVGRNANITYQPLHQKLPADFSGAGIYINLYDCFTKSKSHQLQDIRKFVECHHECFEKVCVLLPSSLQNRKCESELNGFLKQLDSRIGNRQTVYLPTLFGPHQPESFLFQQIISNSSSGSVCVDDTRSAIYVKDAANALIKIRENSKSKNIQLVSDIPDSWKETLRLLGGSDPEKQYDLSMRDTMPSGVEKLEVKSSSSLEEVLKLQRDC